MAELSDVAVLCKFDDSSVIQLSEGYTEDCVVCTANQQISVYNVGLRKVVHSWFVESGQQLTSPAVQLSDGEHYSVIIDQKIIQSWSKNDESTDQKSQKIELAKPAHRLFPLKNNIILILNDDATVTFSNNPAACWGKAADSGSIVWCGATTYDGGVTMVAVYETRDAKRHIVKFSLTVGEDSVQDVQILEHPASAGDSIVDYCLQSENNIYLIILYGNGKVNRTALVSESGSLLTASTNITLEPADPASQYKSVIALDDLQIAAVRQHHNTAYVEVWDVKYCTKHSEATVDLSVLGPVQQLRKQAGDVLLACGLGVYTIPFELRPVTLLRAMSSRNNSTPRFIQHCLSTGGLKEDIVTTFAKLADASQTPAYKVFRKEFSKLSSWMKICEKSPEVRLFALPLVDATIQRFSDTSDTFWPVEELKALATAGLVSNNVCRSLFEAILLHHQFDLLYLCLTAIKDIPEAAIVLSLEGILQKENEELFSKFNLTKEQLLNLVLNLPYNECFMMEYVWRLEFGLVLELTGHLYNLWNSDKVSNMQVCMWMYILSGSHSQQFNLFSESDSMLRDFLEKVTTEITNWMKLNVEPEINLDEAKLKAIQENSRKHNGYYITSFIHPFDD